MKVRLLAALQAGIAYSLTFVGGGLFLPAGDTSYRDIVIRDAFVVGVVCLIVAMLCPKMFKPYLIGSFCATALLAAIAAANLNPSSLLPKLLFAY